MRALARKGIYKGLAPYSLFPLLARHGTLADFTDA